MDNESSNETVKVDVHAPEAGVLEIIHRHGKAAVINEPSPERISGHIDSPSRYYQHRKNQADLAKWPFDNSYLEVDTQKAKVTLHVDPSDDFAPTVTGSVKMNPHLIELDINGTKKPSKDSFKRMLKQFRFLFKDQSACSEFVKKLDDVVVNIERELAESNDSRGNKRNLFDQKLKADLPETIDLYMPIFVEGDKVHIQAEVCFDVGGDTAGDLQFWLESPELFETIEVETAKMVAEEVKTFDDEIVIIYK